MNKEFKGTAGDWRMVIASPIFTKAEGYPYVEISSPDLKVWVAKVRGDTEEEMVANGKLIGASKKIAFELHNLLDALCGEQEAEDEIEKAFGKMIAHRIFMAKKALKQAL